MKSPRPQAQRPSAPLRFCTRLLHALVYALPAVLFFSYYPVISLGSDATMNFELSLPLIWLVVFDLAALIALILLQLSASRLRRQSAPDVPAAQPAQSARSSKSAKLAKSAKSLKSPRPAPDAQFTSWGFNFAGISDRRIFLWTLLPFYATISAFWSANPLRALLTAGVIWLVFFAVFAILYILPLLAPSPHFRRRLFAIFFIATAAVCVFCFVQSLLDLCGVGRDATLLCAGCTYRSFGFPHPSGFAIEPQFMGNLLLAPTLCALYFLIFRTPAARSHRLALTLFAALFSLTLFFTFSRGAIYAYLIALCVLLVFAIRRHRFRPSLVIIPLLTFILSLGLQGTMSALGPTSETFVSGITKSIHHLSLGVVDLRPTAEDNASAPNPSASDQPASDPSSTAGSISAPDSDDSASALIGLDSAALQPAFDGYVAESTNTRLELNAVAFATWSRRPLTFLFGVGLGGAGTAMHDFAPAIVTSAKEIVQNQPMSLLLELGLVGAALVIFTLFLAFCPHLFSPRFLDGRDATPAQNPARAAAATSGSARRSASASCAAPARFSPFWSHPALPLLAALLLAYLVTLQFFSGLPNALQIYLLPPLLYLALAKKP